MKIEQMPRMIKSMHFRKILNSHVQFTNEYIIELDNGTFGFGAAPKGETVSLHRKTKVSLDPIDIIEKFRQDGMLNVPLSQQDLDAYLESRMGIFGIGSCYALSLAFLDAHKGSARWVEATDSLPNSHFPKICLNVLNGGWHAYTNPVLSDFPEFLLMARSSDIKETIDQHNEIQSRIHDALSKCDKVTINGNAVNRQKENENRVWLAFLIDILDELGYSSKYDLMIDASAGDLVSGAKYHFPLTDGSLKSKSEMLDYWLGLIKTYKLSFLEDPFCEQDFENWANLTKVQSDCKIIGDNIYASDPTRIRDGAEKSCTHGIMLKPDASGTVSAAVRSIKAARDGNQIIVTSHRSISTESTFLSELTHRYRVEYIKIGPLNTDYSSVIRFNELIRLSGAGFE